MIRRSQTFIGHERREDFGFWIADFGIGTKRVTSDAQRATSRMRNADCGMRSYYRSSNKYYTTITN